MSQEKANLEVELSKWENKSDKLPARECQRDMLQSCVSCAGKSCNVLIM